MTGDDYQLLLWLLGKQPHTFNQLATTVIAVWFSLATTWHILKKLYHHLDYHLDTEFWHDVLPEENVTI